MKRFLLIGPDNFPSLSITNNVITPHLLGSLTLISQQDEISLCSEDRELFQCGWGLCM